MALLLAFLSALVYGCADFCGGKATRRVSASTVTFSSQLAGLEVLAVGLLFAHGSGPSARVLIFGALGGLGGAAGIMLLYHGLAVGTMSIVSPITAVTAAALPVLFGTVLLDERPGVLPVIGIVCALIAIALVSLGPDQHGVASPWRVILISMGAGVGFGAFFVLSARAGDPAEVGLWALVGARPVSIAASGIVARLQGQALFPPKESRRIVSVAGMLDQLANVLYVLAIGQGGLLSLLAVLASLYPVSTVALARFVDHERLRPLQVAGLASALVGLVLIAS